VLIQPNDAFYLDKCAYRVNIPVFGTIGVLKRFEPWSFGKPMPNIKSASKRMRQNIKRRAANRAQRSALRTAEKKIQLAIVQGDKEAAQASLQPALSNIGKSASKGIISKNAAARKSSRLMKKMNAAQQESAS
jgi:small subunit ribosomal protein S20